MNELIENLQNTANKLRMMWGNNPDSEIIEQGIEALKAKAPAAPEAPQADLKVISRKKA